MKKILLGGAGGHARSCIDIVESEGKFEIAGFVKSHEVSKYNGGKETMINRVKVRT